MSISLGLNSKGVEKYWAGVSKRNQRKLKIRGITLLCVYMVFTSSSAEHTGKDLILEFNLKLPENWYKTFLLLTFISQNKFKFCKFVLF